MPLTTAASNVDKNGDKDDDDEEEQARAEEKELKFVEGVLAKVRNLRKVLLTIQGMEIGSFILYYVLLFAVRIPETWTTVVPSGEFVTGLVAGTTLARTHSPPTTPTTNPTTTHSPQSLIGRICLRVASCISIGIWYPWSTLLQPQCIAHVWIRSGI